MYGSCMLTVHYRALPCITVQQAACATSGGGVVDPQAVAATLNQVREGSHPLAGAA